MWNVLLCWWVSSQLVWFQLIWSCTSWVGKLRSILCGSEARRRSSNQLLICWSFMDLCLKHHFRTSKTLLPNFCHYLVPHTFCEQAFSSLKINKSKNRPMLTDCNLNAVMRITTSKLVPHFKTYPKLWTVTFVSLILINNWRLPWKKRLMCTEAKLRKTRLKFSSWNNSYLA